MSLPQQRVGALLRGARGQAHLSARVAAHRLGISKSLLLAWERGDLPVPDESLAAIADLYQVSRESLAPARRGVTVDRDALTMTIGHHVEPLPSPDASPDEILEEYLHVLYEIRRAKPTDAIPLRDDDLNTLADALGNTPESIERRLVELMGISREDAIRLRRIILRRRVLTPAAGLVLSAGMLGGLRVFDGPPSPHTEQLEVSTQAPRSAPSSTTAAPATPTTLAPPVTTTTTTAATSLPAPAPTPTTAAPAPAVKHASPAPTTTTAPAPVVDAPGDDQASRPVEVPPIVIAPPTTTAPGPPVVNVDAPGDDQVSQPGQ